MTCAWKELLAILPAWLRQEVEQRKDKLQEIRMRQGKAVQLICNGGDTYLQMKASSADLSFTVNAASRYSPWTAGGAAFGYITAPGGHRLGLCGDAVVKDGKMTGLRSLASLNIRVARDFPGIGRAISTLPGSILILGAPGSGKTTLLRDLLRQLSLRETVAVVDERGEIFPEGFDSGQALDILRFCPKPQGLDAVIRTMSPRTVAIDEVTASADCEALYRAGWCGVRLVATAHAASGLDFMERPVYRPLVDSKLFTYLVILDSSKHFTVEKVVP